MPDNSPASSDHEAQPEIHRPLFLTSPHMKGADVRQLQQRCNEIQDTFDSILAFKVAEDGEAGDHSFNVFWSAAHVMGLSEDTLHDIRHGKMTKDAQQDVRQPDSRSKDAVERAQERRDTMRERLKKAEDGGAKAAEWARAQLGKTESPSGSNLGPGITEWQQFTGYGVPPGVFWCGCFVCYAVVHEGGADIPSRIRLGYDLNIVDDARNNTNGLSLVPTAAAQPGDIVVYDFRHIGLIVGPTEGGLVHTIEGNTSSTTGQVNNGGGVFEHRRSISDVVAVARPAY
jgi:hypothetical protein